MPKLAEQDDLTGILQTSSVPQWADDLQTVQRFVAPAWPLRDMVAVNPFEGVSEYNFLALRNKLATVRDGDLLPPLSYFQQKFDRGDFSLESVQKAFADCRNRRDADFGDISFKDVSVALMRDSADERERSERRIFTIAETVEHLPCHTGITWPRAITDEISRFCAAYFDQGQAAWKMPVVEEDLYTAWRSAMRIDRRAELKGLKGFRTFVTRLPSNPADAIAQMIGDLRLDPFKKDVLLTQLMSIPGWAAYVKYCDRESGAENTLESELLGLLAIRLAYDAGLVNAGIADGSLYRLATQTALAEKRGHASTLSNHRTAAIRMVLQTAIEVQYRDELVIGLESARAATTRTGAVCTSAQMVFCIDVRSEPLRRHVESSSPTLETFGFAGFFGIAANHAEIGVANGTPQCPVLLSPTVTARDESEHPAALKRSVDEKNSESSWRSFQGSAMAGFAFVESCGLGYAWNLIADTLRLPTKQKNLKTKPQLVSASEGDFAARGQMAQSILQNLGLTKNFARLVVFCGHGSQTKNNPLAASLDCGACGGHSGEVNARLAADLLNDQSVRAYLAQNDIHVPPQTHFMAGLHNTTTDDVSFPDAGSVPDSHLDDLLALQSVCDKGSHLARAERAVRFGAKTRPEQIEPRSRDWSEIRPEWGLAGNAAFVVAPRKRTQSLRLGGRVFLHSYDHKLDSEFKTLELIMTAPMVVTNWINMQYYASTVDNKNYGCGNKALHNVVSGIGVLEGNSGDLRTGLPVQSIHDGNSLQHAPLRLSVFIDAPAEEIQKVLIDHEHIRKLVVGGWLHLYCIDGEARQYMPNDSWAAVETPLPTSTC